MKYFSKIFEKHIELCQFRYSRIFKENNLHLNCINNQFSSNAPFLCFPENIRKAYFLKKSENLWFSNVFMGGRNGTFAENGSFEIIAQCELEICVTYYI